MKDYKKILILLILFFVVTGLTISTVNAATKTTGKIYFKDEFFDKSTGKGDIINDY